MLMKGLLIGEKVHASLTDCMLMKGLIIGEKVVQEGVIAIPSPKSIGLCAGVTPASYATTTEVYRAGVEGVTTPCA